MNISQEYIGAIVLLLGAILKLFGIEIPSSSLEGLLAGIVAVWIAYRRFKKGDINLLGGKK